MAENLRPDVFISYSSKNKEIADEIVKEFESNNIKYWYAPRDIMPGEEWVSAIDIMRFEFRNYSIRNILVYA